jgi:type VI secretion system protein ImpC
MTKPLSFGKIEVGLTTGTAAAAAVEKKDGPFRIALLGDFSGRASRGLHDRLAGRRPIAVDRDNFDQVMEKLGAEVHLPVAGAQGPGIVIRFKELDDFRPERIFDQVEVFASLRQTRAKLKNPATFADTAAQMRSWAKPEAEPATQAAAAPPSAPAPVPENILDHILGETSSRPRESMPAAGATDWNAYLQSIVAPFVVPKADPLQAELITQVDTATGALMRSVLHHPYFQALEAAWRGLYFLVRRLDSDGPLKLLVLDISREELAADLAAAEDLRPTGLYRLLVEQTVGTPGAPPWAVLAGNYSFGPTAADVELLGRLAKIAQQAGAPFLAAALPAVLGCASLARTPDPDDWRPQDDPDGQEAWAVLRALPETAYLGLALPRFLLRLPYGKETDPTDPLVFEELPQAASHESYLWGNPAFACACLLGQAFNHAGWNMRAGLITELDGLPLHVYEKDGESETKPCAEAYLSHRAAEVIADRGLMALLSVQGRDIVQLAGFRPVAASARYLAGRWR